MGCIAKIRNMRNSMSNHEQKIADFLLDQTQSVREFNSKDLALAIGVSQSSVVKFSQKLGYTGYSDLKLALTESAVRTAMQPQAIHGDISASDELKTVAQKLVAHKARALTDTVDANSEANVILAVDAIAKARRIVIAGVGSSSLVAKDFAFKLMKLGKSVLAESDTHVQVANAACLDPQDLVFAISESGATQEVVRIAATGLEQGAQVISLTGLSKNPLMELAQINLFTLADEAAARSSSILARTAQHMMTDLLFLLLTQRDEHSLQLFERARKAVQVFRAQ